MAENDNVEQATSPSDSADVETMVGAAFKKRGNAYQTAVVPNSITNRIESFDFEPFHDSAWTPPNPDKINTDSESPGIAELTAHEYKNWSLIGSNIKSYEKGQALKPDNTSYENPSHDPIPDNWTPWQDRNVFYGVSREYWDTLSMAKSPKDLEARVRYAKDQMAKDEYFAKSSPFQKIISKSLGIPGGLVLDPYNLIPFSAALKYAKVSQNILMGAAKGLPTLAGISALNEGINFSQDTDMDYRELGYNTIRDTLAGTFMIAGGRGLSRGWEGYKMFNAKKAMNLNMDGMGLKWNVGEKGELLGYTASPMGNVSFSAAATSRAQEFADSQFAKTGLFWFPQATKLFSPISPVMRGLNSTYGSVRALTNRMVDHDFNTVGGNKHVPDQTSFQKRFDEIQGDATMFGVNMEGLRKQYNGIDLTSTEEQALKQLNSSLDKKDPSDPASFGNRVYSAVITDTNHESLQVNEAKAALDGFFEKYLNRYQRAMGFSEETLTPRTAKGYMTQIPNRTNMMQDGGSSFVEVVSQELKEQDETISRLLKPVQDIDKQIAQVRLDIKNGTNLTENREALESLRRDRRVAHDSMIAEIRDEHDHQVLLRDRNLLSSDEADQLKALLKPSNDIKKLQKKAEKDISKVKRERANLARRLEAKSKKGVSDEQIQNEHAQITQEIASKDKDLSILENVRDKHENDFISERGILHDQAMEGKINERFFYKKQNSPAVEFRDPNALPKFRPLYEDDNARIEEARGMFESYMNLSDEQIMNRQAENLAGILKEDPLFQRSVMIKSETLLNNGFLNTDLPSIAYNYATGIGKYAALQESLHGLGIAKNGVEGVVELIGKEYKDKLKSIDHLRGDKRIKAQSKLAKEFKKEKAFAQQLIDAMMGNHSHDQSLNRIATDLRNLTASNRLGFVPLTQVSDMIGNTFKHGVWRFVRDGFAPAVTTMNGKLKTSSAERYRTYASEANLCLEHFRINMNRKFYGADPFSDPTPSNSFSAGLEKAAHLSGNLSGMNALENFNQGLTANLVQSKIMDYMNDFVKGTLSAKKIKELGRAGINPEEWAQRFVEQGKQFGSKGVFGGHQSYYYNWSDTGAKVKMANSMRNMVRNTIIQRGRADMPFVLNNPVLSLVTQFMGWGFAAFNRFTIPLLQRFEVNQITGTVLLGMVASMEGITRKIARGQEVDMDDENLMVEAFSNSAPFSMVYKAAMLANTMMDNKVLTGLQNDKQRNITQLGLLGGPGFGVATDFAKVLSMIGTGQYNQQDINKGFRTIPMMQSWWQYQLNQKFLDSVYQKLDIPETKESASTYWE